MQKTQFKIGDAVQLVSGGPRMTVIATKGGKTECCWFDKEQKPRRALFPQKALAPAVLEEMPDEQLNALMQKGHTERAKKKNAHAR
jgi:uncharacterized protein YodC (DUF2158 family)